MKIGMLWFDDDQRRNLDEKVARAAAYYTRKYGARPTAVYVHPAMVAVAQPAGAGEPPISAGGLKLNTAPSILVNHFWVGVEERERHG